MARPLSHAVNARFSELKPFERLVLTNTIVLPEVETYESTIAVDFFRGGSNTCMVVTLEPMHNEEFTRTSKMRLTSQLGKLDKRFGRTG